MWESYLLILLMFGVVIALRIYLFKRSFTNKLKYFCDPMHLA